ncbi:PorT family protein [Algoriphagus aestuarii]|nr:PorT family protein [Algoriphagus aestuarii]
MRCFLSLVFFLGFVAFANGQAGIRAGLSSSDITNSNVHARLGAHAGVYYRQELGFFAIEPGVQFSQRGFRGNDRDTGKRTFERLNYVDAPLLIRFNFFPEINLFIGPQLSFLMSRKYEFEGFVDTNKEPFPKTEFGGVGGIGIHLPYGMNIQATFDVSKNDLGDYYPDRKNKVFKLSLGYDFF